MRSTIANRRESAVTAHLGEKPGAKRCSYLVLILPHGYCLPMLFQPPQEELYGRGDRGGAAPVHRLRRAASTHADVSLAGVCAEHLVDGLRAAGLIVARPVQWRLHRWKSRQVVSLASAAATEGVSGDLPNAEKRSDPDLSLSSRGAGGPGAGA